MWFLNLAYMEQLHSAGNGISILAAGVLKSIVRTTIFGCVHLLLVHDMCISRYFCQKHPEYYAKIMDYHDFKEFDAISGNYGMDLYVLELNRCEDSDAGFRIAKRLRDNKVNCAITFVVPSESLAIGITREMLRPSYIFLKAAAAAEINSFLDSFLLRSDEMAFMEFTFQYRKWLVNIENILYIQTCGARVMLVCSNATLESTERLSDLERRLPGYFIRVDKGCLINTKQLVSVDFAQKKAMFGSSDFVYMSRRGAKKLYDTLYGE